MYCEIMDFQVLVSCYMEPSSFNQGWSLSEEVICDLYILCNSDNVSSLEFLVASLCNHYVHGNSMLSQFYFLFFSSLFYCLWQLNLNLYKEGKYVPYNQQLPKRKAKPFSKLPVRWCFQQMSQLQPYRSAGCEFVTFSSYISNTKTIYELSFLKHPWIFNTQKIPS